MDRPPAIFVGDAAGLDFLNSAATPVDQPVDWIADGAGLLDWLAQAGLMPAHVLKDIGARASTRDLDAIARQARELREWYRAFVQKHKGRSLRSKDLNELEPLSRLLRRDTIFRRIAPRNITGPIPFEISHIRGWGAPEALLFPVAEALAGLVCEEDFAFIRACEGASCTLLFSDHTRGKARRWCSMAVCGNRAKQATHRERSRGNDIRQR